MQDNLKQYMKQFNSINPKYIYYHRPLTHDNVGIDYTKFLKMRHDSITQKHIKTLYTADGWYLLWILLSKSYYRNYYMETSVSYILEISHFTIQKFKQVLLHLIDKNVIYATCEGKEINSKNIKNIKSSQTIQIVIGYCLNDYYDGQEGFKAIPVEYVEHLLPNLTPNEFAIYSVLFMYHSVFTIQKRVSEETGEIYYTLQENEYAFPTMEQMSEIIGISPSTIYRAINDLVVNKYKPIKLNNNDMERTSTGRYTNSRYKISILDRIEYIYYRIINLSDSREEKIIKEIQSKGFDKIIKEGNGYILTPRDYYRDRYKAIIDIEQCINNNKEQDWYKNNRANLSTQNYQ